MDPISFQRLPGGQLAQAPAAPASVVPPQSDPQSQYLAQALQAMGGAQPRMGNVVGLDSRLLAEALNRWSQQPKPPPQTPPGTAATPQAPPPSYDDGSIGSVFQSDI